MKSDEPPKPPVEKTVNELISEENLSDEQFEEQLTKELRVKKLKELDDNQIFALRNCI